MNGKIRPGRHHGDLTFYLQTGPEPGDGDPWLAVFFDDQAGSLARRVLNGERPSEPWEWTILRERDLHAGFARAGSGARVGVLMNAGLEHSGELLRKLNGGADPDAMERTGFDED